MIKRENLFVDLLIGAFTLILIGLSVNYFLNKDNSDYQSAEDTQIVELQKPRFGFAPENHHFDKLEILPNQFLADILEKYAFSYTDIAKLEQSAKNVFSVRHLRSGKDLTFVSQDSCSSPFCMIYQPDPFRYVKYNLVDSMEVEIIENEFSVLVDTLKGEITSSLWSSMIDNGHKATLIDKMEDAFASKVDFYYTQKGDRYKLIYEKRMIDGEFISYGDILGAYYDNDQGRHYAIYYENDKYEGFYDVEGRPTKGNFLRAPVKYSRISSRFNRNRFHPIKKRRIPHLGTDYAAAHGTPIHSVSAGVVEIAGYTKNNGKYVKIKHGKTYKTQYLHMSRFAKGIRKGRAVKQGETIGYVGSTGLATGPHVCFRFWKNGKQINHLRENFPPGDPMSEEEMPLFEEMRDKMIIELTRDEPTPSPAT